MHRTRSSAWPSPKPTRRMPNWSSSAGDLTNTGSDEELEHVYGLMSQLEKPWFTVMGNHETTWSESGCTTFRCIFGHDGRVAYRAGGYLFLGYNCGPT